MLRYGANDQVTAAYHFDPNNRPEIEQIVFSDGVTWDRAAIRARVTAIGSSARDVLYAYDDGENRTYGQGGDDTIYGGAQSDVLYGGPGQDDLYGRDGADTLYGEADNDWLYGEAGDDILDGGMGDDKLYGGTGGDTYVFGIGSGQDRISENDATVGTVDVIRFLDVKSTELTGIERLSNDLVLRYGANDQVTAAYHFDPNNRPEIEQIVFSDGVTWDRAAIRARVTAIGSSARDVLYAYDDGENRTYGQGGDDTIYGGAQSDMLDGGPGNDELFGKDGADTLYGGADNDYLYGDAGADTLYGGAGDDKLYGGTGGDTYVFGIGSGQDRISENDATVGAVDVIRFVDVKSTDLTGIERLGNDLVLTYGASDQITVVSHFDANNRARIEQIVFSDGVVWGDTAINGRVQTPGWSDDTVIGTDDPDVMYGTASADILFGRGGADRLEGSSGNDSILGEEGADTLFGVDGDDSLMGGTEDDTLYGGSGNDTLLGEDGADTLDGGAGNDTLVGGSGPDTYVFGNGSGVDRIIENDSTPGVIDLMTFTDVASSEVLATERHGNDLVLQYGTGDEVTVADYFNPDSAAGRIEQIQFNDGVTWDEAAVKAVAITNGGAGYDEIRGYDDGENRIFGKQGNDSLIGGQLADLLDGGEGNDALIGGDGADTLIGGIGNDTLTGGNGGDTYVFGKGNGQDRIIENDPTPDTIDVVQFTDVQSTEIIAIERLGNYLVLRVRG